MAYLINLKTHTDNRGSLTVLEKEIPFDIKRVFYLHDLNKNKRAEHRHYNLIEAVVCLNGNFKTFIKNKNEEKEFFLDNPNKCLIINPEDWRVLHSFSEDCIVLVLASTHYDPQEYIYEEYR